MSTEKITFRDSLQSLLQTAQDFIVKNIKEGQEIVLLTEDDINSDKFYGQPVFSFVSKHGYYQEYAVMSIRKEADEIIVKGYEKGEGSDYDEMNINNITESYTLCYLADMVAEKLEKE